MTLKKVRVMSSVILRRRRQRNPLKPLESLLLYRFRVHYSMMMKSPTLISLSTMVFPTLLSLRVFRLVHLMPFLTGGSGGGKQVRRRPPSWKRKAQARKSALSTPAVSSTPKEIGGKRKPDSINSSPAKKFSVPSTNSVASSLKPLLLQ